MLYPQGRFPRIPVLPGLRLFLTILFSFTALGQSDHKAISQMIENTWDNKSGLPQATVLNLLQDQQGYIWIGTQEGLVRFDGTTMKLFDRAHYPQLKSDYVFSLTQRSNGTIWVGTRVGLYTIRQGILQLFPRETGPPTETISALQEDGDQMWLGTPSGLFRYKNGRFKEIPFSNQLPSPNVQSLLMDQKRRLWIGTMEGIACFKDGKRIPLPPGGVPRTQVKAIFQTSEGHLWFGTQEGAYRLYNGEWLSYSRSDGLPGNHVLSFEEHHKGLIWIGTDRGITRYKNGFFLDDPKKIPMNTVHELLVDKEGSIWLGTQSKGLKRLSPGIMTPVGFSEGLPPHSVRSIAGDGKDGMWLATRGGLVHWTKKAIKVLTTEQGLISNNLKVVFRDSKGRLWLGTGFNGAMVLEDNKVIKTYQKGQGITGNTIRTIAEDDEGTIYLASTDGGVSIIKESGITNLTTKQGLTSNTVLSLLPTEEGLWIGYQSSGVDFWKDGHVTHYSQKDGIPGNSIFCFLKRENGDLWLGSDSGLSRFDGKGFQSVQIQDGLHNGLAFSIMEDDIGGFWMTCNKGVYRIELKAMEHFLNGKLSRIRSTVLDTSNGMRNQECNFGGYGSSYKDSSGQIWFPTISGVVKVDPQTAMEPPKIPPIRLEKAVINQRPLPEALFPIELGAGVENLEIHYTALAFTLSKKIRFQYFLEGFDDKWVDAGNRRTAYYTNLPPGDYRFHLRFDLGDGAWQETLVPWSFTIQPHWYQNIYVWFLCSLCVVFLLWQVYRLKEIRHKAQQAQLEYVVKERTQALAETNQQLLETRGELINAARKTGQAEVTTNVLHNMGNALNSLNVTTNVLVEQLEKSKVPLLQRVTELLEEHAQDPDFFQSDRGRKAIHTLTKISEQLGSQHRQFKDEVQGLERQVFNQNELIRAQQNVFDTNPNFREEIDLRFILDEVIKINHADLQDIKIVREYEIAEALFLEKNKLTQVLLHLVNNSIQALQNNPIPSTLTVQCKKRATQAVEITLTDNGIGIEKENLAKIFFNGFSSWEGKDGFGLHHCANIVGEMGGRLWAESEGLGKGASFKIVLPISPQVIKSKKNVALG